MIFSRSTEYGIKAVLFLALHCGDGQRYGIKTIAKNLNLPEPFMGKVLQILSRKGIISSIKGPNGGFFFRQEELSRPMLDVVDAIDGLHIFKQCAIGINHCDDNHPCPVHQYYGPARDLLYQALKTRTIADFTTDLEQGISFL